MRQSLEDLVTFGTREDVSPIAKAAIFHVQFETIHPFMDGSGRTGPTLPHRMLARDEVLHYAMLPVSAGLLHDVERYMGALGAYHDGAIESIIECLADALELVAVIGARIASDVEGVLDRWASANTDRAGSASHRPPRASRRSAVVDAAFVASNLGITGRAARNLIATSCERGILARMGNAKRGAFYQASDPIAVLEEVSSLEGIRRIAAC